MPRRANSQNQLDLGLVLGIALLWVKMRGFDLPSCSDAEYEDDDGENERRPGVSASLLL